MILADAGHLLAADRHQPRLGEFEDRASNDGLPVGRDLQNHELVADSRRHGVKTMFFAEIEKRGASAGDVLKRRQAIDVLQNRQRFGLDGNGRQRLSRRRWRFSFRFRDDSFRLMQWRGRDHIRNFRLGKSRRRRLLVGSRRVGRRDGERLGKIDRAVSGVERSHRSRERETAREGRNTNRKPHSHVPPIE
ncbi:hypothetical protein [uncultured Rhodoblastus sp.]|uniref:hypothetical protein n=1 Tax=uncultured Rhodoblastus sp. TaxID=543037 RepID=UPI0025CFD502|nr:hypothetical protein [uncultured Rhodoblastus sp.]